MTQKRFKNANGITIDIISLMKDRIKENPILKGYLDDIMAKGIDEDIALDIMIYAWLKGEDSD